MKPVIRDLIILLCLCLVLVVLWFSKGLIFAGGEEGIPFYDLERTAKLISYAWQDISAGYSNLLILNRIPYFSFLKIFSSIGFPGFLVQALHFFIIMSAGSVSLYFLLRETVARELELNKQGGIFGFVPLIGAIFYLLNPFSMAQIWGRGLYLQFFPFVLFPFFLLMFILGLQRRNFVYGIWGLLASVFLAGSFGNPSYIFSFWTVPFAYLLFYIFRNRSVSAILFSLAYFLFILAGWVVTQMWWIYPFIKVSSNQFAAALNNTEANLGTLRGISRDYRLPSLLRLIHEGFYYRDLRYGESYVSAFFLLLGWIFPFMAVYSYKTFKKLKIFLFFAGLFLFSLFITSGSNPPAGRLFIALFEAFPAFQAFRNPFEKFGVVLTIAYAPFFAVGAAALSKRIGKTAVFLILFLSLGVYLWPMWTGQFAGGIRLNPWVRVPDDYASFNGWSNQQKSDGRIIHLPINPGDGLKYSGWQYPYQGIEPSEYLLDRPSIGKYGQPSKLYYKFLLDRFDKFKPNAYSPDPDFSNSEFQSNSFFEELVKLNVRYIVLHFDIDPDLGDFGKPEPVAEYLEKQDNISRLVSFGKLEIYRVDIPENIRLIYSPTAAVTYLKINPALYKITANTKQPFDLYFLENYDPNWEAYLDGQKIENHSRVFSYANKWRIEKTGNIEVAVKYKPQDFVEEGMRVTKVAVLAGSLICLSYFIWKLKKT